MDQGIHIIMGVCSDSMSFWSDRNRACTNSFIGELQLIELIVTWWWYDLFDFEMRIQEILLRRFTDKHLEVCVGLLGLFKCFCCLISANIG